MLWTYDSSLSKANMTSLLSPIQMITLTLVLHKYQYTVRTGRYLSEKRKKERRTKRRNEIEQMKQKRQTRQAG